MRTRSSWLAGVIALLLPAGVGAQARVKAGDRVRVQALERVFIPTTTTPAVVSSRIGVLSRTTRDSLWLNVRTALHSLSRDDDAIRFAGRSSAA
jgi:hypothetical protein